MSTGLLIQKTSTHTDSEHMELSKSENPALNNAVELADKLASVHLFLDKGEAGLINDGDSRMHLHRNGRPSVIIDGGSDARYPMPEQPLGEKMLQKIDPRFNQQMQQKMHQMLNPQFMA